MQIKAQLRRELLSKRKNIADKKEKDLKICNNLLNSLLYINCDKILFFAALDDEINTDYAIEAAISRGKTVYLPKCIDNCGNMDFYKINSLDELITGSFNVREPKGNSDKFNDCSNALCVVPAISYDLKGFRLGYGKGYYDRFLEKFSSVSVGLCYNEMIIDKIPADRLDLPVNYIITEDSVFSV